MLFINHATDVRAAKSYFTSHLSKSDYYLRDAQEIPGEWHGRGAELLGLSGTVDKETYFRLCENTDPRNGHRLTSRTKTARRVYYDLTFNAPKSVTLAYELGGDERILDAFRESVKETMDEMENEMRVRVRADGQHEDRASCNWIWCDFIHRTTRPVTDDQGISVPDPALHIHAVALNLSYDPVEEKWKAGEFNRVVAEKGYSQTAYLSRLSQKLSALGYGIERDGTSFRLKGIDRATCDAFSRRSQIIQAEAKRLGLDTPEGKRALGKRTREAKSDAPLSMAELRRLWRNRISDAEEKAIVEARTGQENTAWDADKAVEYAVSHCFERASTVTQKNLLKTALIHSFGNGTVADVRNAAQRADILRKEKNGQLYVTSREVLQEEVSITDYVRAGKGTRRRLGGDGPLELDAHLSEEQRQAALVLLNSRDRVVELKGRAGVGKTTMMRATVDAIERSGKTVFAVAPSAEAAHGVLRAEGFHNAETVERLLIDQEMQKEIHGQVLYVDEAGLLSVKDMKRLFDMAQQQDARIVLAGDTLQNNSVQRGDALRILEKDAGMTSAALTQIRRQTNDAYREAVAAIAEGDTIGKSGETRFEEGLELLDKMGAIIEHRGVDRFRKIADDYASTISQRKKNGESKTCLVVAPTHAEIRHVTQAIRERLKATGTLSGSELEFTTLRALNFTEAERTDCTNYLPGEIVQFHQNAKGGFKRGERVTVTRADQTGLHVTRLDGSCAVLYFTEAKKFQVYRTEKLALSEGDRLRITMNGFVPETRAGLPSKKNRLNNGATYQVAGFTRQGDIELTNGFVIPKNYGGLSYGYAMTAQSSQGKTVDVSLIALGAESFAAAHRESFYVALSRGREAVRLYTDDRAAMMDAVRGSTARLSATELMRSDAEPPQRKPDTRERLSCHARREFHRRRERIAAHDINRRNETRQQLHR